MAGLKFRPVGGDAEIYYSCLNLFFSIWLYITYYIAAFRDFISYSASAIRDFIIGC